jgi:hypothetical protein
VLGDDAPTGKLSWGLKGRALSLFSYSFSVFRAICGLLGLHSKVLRWMIVGIGIAFVRIPCTIIVFAYIEKNRKAQKENIIKKPQSQTCMQHF